MSRLIAIDPGTTHSAYVVLASDGRTVEAFGIRDNDAIRVFLGDPNLNNDSVMAIEMVASYGQPVGEEVFETVRWIGRFEEAWCRAHARWWEASPVLLIKRPEVKMALCYTTKGVNDSVIRQRVIDIYGGKSAIGTKKAPGPLYGLKADEWQALAIALVARERLASASGK